MKIHSIFNFIAFSLFICTTLCLTSCYRMPGENDYSLVPTTNNPAVTCEKNDNILPSMKY